MKCPIEARENADLLAYCAGTLNGERRAVLDEHLRACHACANSQTGRRQFGKRWMPGKRHRCPLDSTVGYMRGSSRRSPGGPADEAVSSALAPPGVTDRRDCGVGADRGLMFQNPVAVMQPKPPSRRK